MRRHANTLMEMMISIAVIGVLVSMLVPAIQKARESANRATCANNMKQVCIGVHNYEVNYKQLPAGYQQVEGPSSMWCGNTWLAQILPFIEQENVLKTYDFKEPYASVNNVPAATSPTAAMISTFMCPSDQLPAGPFQISGPDITAYYAPCSYVGNTGSGIASFPLSQTDSAYNPDGVLNIVSPAFPYSIYFGLNEIPDGQSHTALFGERFHFDPAFDAASTLGPLSNWSAWGWVGDIQATGHVLGSGQVLLNNRMTGPPTPASMGDRLSGFGSAHSSGCQFAMCDGSVVYVRSNIDLNTLKQLCSRHDGPPTGALE